MKLLALLVTLAVAAPVRAAPATAPAEVPSLIAELGHCDYQVRNDASARLRKIGKPALPALRQAAAGPDPEVRQRCVRLIRRIENPGLIPGPRPLDEDAPAAGQPFLRAPQV